MTRIWKINGEKMAEKLRGDDKEIAEKQQKNYKKKGKKWRRDGGEFLNVGDKMRLWVGKWQRNGKEMARK